MTVFNPYSLILSGHYDRDPGLDNYLLVLIHLYDGQVNQWLCTSSNQNGQQRGDQHEWGGIIPPVHHVKELHQWQVDLDPIYMPDNKGVRGNFYRILPHSVITTKGKTRGDFGIHFDANVPGSLGCPVMNRFNWTDFERTIAEIKTKSRVARIPLYPLYS